MENPVSPSLELNQNKFEHVKISFIERETRNSIQTFDIINRQTQILRPSQQ